MFNSDNVLVPEVVEAGFDPFRARVAMGGFLAGYSGATVSDQQVCSGTTHI